MHIAKLSLLGETAVEWDSASARDFHALSLEVSKELQNITNRCTRNDAAKMMVLPIKHDKRQMADVTIYLLSD